MHTPKIFKQSDLAEIHGLIESHPLGALITNGADGLEANHIPFELDRDAGPYGTLLGHVARANPVWQTGADEILVVFQGANNYVSPGWYATKQVHGKVVPTWNYVVAHAYGTLRPIEDRDWIRSHMERMTNRHEAASPAPWQVSDAPETFTERMLRAVVGVDITLTRFEAKWKASQNRPATDRDGVAEGLRREGHDDAVTLARIVESARR
ncbi:MAG: FMN-binding negative transcriptional regulator [Pseudomonadota bacterium]